MNVLLVWATNSGTTQVVAGMIEQALTAAGHAVTSKEIRLTSPEDITNAQVILLGSPSWDFDGNEGFPHEDFMPFIEKMKTQAVTKPFAVFGLGDSSYRIYNGAVDHLEKFVADMKGTILIPSLKIDKYYSDEPANVAKVNAWIEELTKKLTT